MSIFHYTARNASSGEAVKGEATAENERQLAMDLRSQGFLLTSAKEEQEKVRVKFLDRFQGVPLKDKMVFTRNLGVMIGSGLTVSRATHNLATQTRNKHFQEILRSIGTDIESGKTFASSLAQYPAVFDELFVNMIYVGEVSGNLEKVLDILATQLEKEHEISSKVKGALMYPAVVLVAMVGIGVLMLTYILPQIVGVFKDMQVELPKATVFIMGLSDFLRTHPILVVGIVLGSVVGIKTFAGTLPGKRFFGFVLLRTPVIGGIIIKVNCARFARIFSSLLKSGVSVTSALTIVSKTLSNLYFRDVLEESVEEIQKGVNLSQVIGRYPKIFPVLVPQMLEVGEETGKTDTILERLALFYEDEVNQITKNLSSILEPILMLLIGGAVGFFAVAMLQPMYSVLENIK